MAASESGDAWLILLAASRSSSTPHHSGQSKSPQERAAACLCKNLLGVMIYSCVELHTPSQNDEKETMKTVLIRSLCRRCGLHPSSRRAPLSVRCRHMFPLACVSVTPTNGRTISLLPSPNCHPFHYGVSRSSQLVRSVVRKHKTLVRMLRFGARKESWRVSHKMFQAAALENFAHASFIIHGFIQGTLPNKSVSASEEAFSQERTYRHQLLMKLALGAEDLSSVSL